MLHDFVALLVVWLGPFGAVWICDGLMRRWRYEPAEIHDVSPRSTYWGWRGFNLNGWTALMVGIGVCLLTINAPILAGTGQRRARRGRLHLDARPLAAGLAYWALARARPARPAQAP